MKVGNQTHAIGLILLLVGAIGFLILQMKGRAKPASVALAPASGITRTDEPQKTSSGLPRTVYGDPFTHLKLPRSVAPKVVAAVATPKRDSTPSPQIGGKFGSLRRNPLGEAFAVSDSAGDPGGVSPVVPHLPDVAAHSAIGNVTAGPMLSLRAVVAAPTAVAFISLDGKAPTEFHVGQTIAKRVSIMRIAEGQIELRLPKGTKTLSVGEKFQL